MQGKVVGEHLPFNQPTLLNPYRKSGLFWPLKQKYTSRFSEINTIIWKLYTDPVCRMGPTVVESSEVVPRNLWISTSSHPWPVTPAYLCRDSVLFRPLCCFGITSYPFHRVKQKPCIPEGSIAVSPVLILPTVVQSLCICLLQVLWSSVVWSKRSSEMLNYSLTLP